MGSNKLLADFRGQPLILATLQQIRQSTVDDILLVLGHDAGAFDEIADHEPVSKFIRNPDYEQGIATSIRVGVAAAGDADAVLICLGDMPLVKPETIDRLIAAFNPTEHRTIIVPTHKGQFGNPVLWGREHFPKLMALEGDRGARSLIAELKSEAVEIAVDDPGILTDADTPEALAELRKG
jgi:molybdenum cofactor cytidylyltransferase